MKNHYVKYIYETNKHIFLCNDQEVAALDWVDDHAGYLSSGVSVSCQDCTGIRAVMQLDDNFTLIP